MVYAESNDDVYQQIKETDQLWEEDRIEEAIQKINHTIPQIVKRFGKLSPEYVNYLDLASRIYQDYGDYNRSLKIIDECLLLKIKLCGNDTIEYAKSLASKACFLSESGRVAESISMYESALNIFKDKNAYYSIENAELIKNYSIVFYELNDYATCLKLVSDAIDILDHIKAPATDYRVANIKVSYATVLSETGNMDLAIKNLLIVVNELNECNCNHLVNILALSNLAVCYKCISDYNNTIKYAVMALELLKKTLGPDTSWTASLMSTLGDAYYLMGNFNEAEIYYKNALTNSEKTLGINHPESISYQEKLVDLYNELNDSSNITSYLSALNRKKINRIIEQLPLLNYSLQEKFWDEDQINWFSQKLPMLCDKYKKEAIYSETYDGLLLSKNLLLDSESHYINALKQHPDQSFFKRYEAIRLLGTDHTILNNDSLLAEERILKLQFIKQSDYMSTFKTTWQDVRGALLSDDAAIEFVNYKDENGCVQYGALVLRNNFTYPKFVKLCSSNELMKIAPKRYYTSNFLPQLIWAPIMKELEGIKNIYFSPAGELYNISLENTLAPDDRRPMSEIYNIYRLSSTRNIISQYAPLFMVSAALFGGMNYNAVFSSSLQSVADVEVFVDSIDLGVFHNSNLTRDGFNYLPASRIEILSAENALKKTSLDISLFLDKDGSKKAFLALSHKSPSIIHLATHGFFHSDNCNVKTMDGHNDESEVNDAMKMSGLLFSGANNTLKNHTNINNINSGILTAWEISNMDLFGVDLVVLSACQTGLGEVRGDGVYGLQRGFKMAGVASLMMSLWKVDDDATQLLMTEFYKNYSSGISKQQSLFNAQKCVRTFKGELNGRMRDFSNPRYWAAFILLDALN